MPKLFTDNSLFDNVISQNDYNRFYEYYTKYYKDKIKNKDNIKTSIKSKKKG